MAAKRHGEIFDKMVHNDKLFLLDHGFVMGHRAHDPVSRGLVNAPGLPVGVLEIFLVLGLASL